MAALRPFAYTGPIGVADREAGMKVVKLGVTEGELAERRRRGLDRLDEVWEGVIHMVPAPGNRHQWMVTVLAAELLRHCRTEGLGRVQVQSNVRDPASGQRDYRVPDLVFVSAERAGIVGETYIDGGPDAVFEVLSEEDETYQKFGFYERIGTGWLVVLTAGGERLELYRLAGERFVQVSPDPEGMVFCDALGVGFLPGAEGLRLRLGRDGPELLLAAP